MSQWGQPGFQYPLQTGFPGAQPQQQFQAGQQLNPAAQFQRHQGGFGAQSGAGLGGGFGGLAPQPTGFPGVRPHALQQPQQTGFPGAPSVGAGLLHAQPTGFLGAQSSFQQRAPPPPVPPLPASYQHNAPPPPPPVPHQQPSFLNASQNRLGVGSSFAGPNLVAQPTGVGLLSQPTGFAGRAPSLVPQVTGFVDPRLQMMSSSFMPASVSAPYTSGGAPQLAPLPQQQHGGLSLQQSFQQHNQAHGRGATPKIPWALSKAEKKQYDQIFRAWDAQGTGFINGQTALEVFGQSGLERNDLARIWTLADADNRGKLNLAEFHVAMGLIYRRLNGNDIPDELPAELVPPSSRDLDTSVNFLKDILKNDTRARSPSGFDTPVSRLKERSFTSSSSFTQQGGRQDATIYKHEDVEPPGGFYQPRNRHVDRSTIRSRADDASPATSDLSSIKRQLLNTQKMLDDTLANEQSSDVLDREMEDLRYRITRLQEDLEYVSKGPRTVAKDEERRRLERELVKLMHEEVPELEKKVEDREARREREKREWTRDRDRRNDRFGRFGDDSSGRYSPASRYREEEERPYSRGASRNDRDDRGYDRDRSYRDVDRDHIRDDDRAPSTATRTPPPPASSTRLPASVPAPPTPARSPAPAMKNMTAEERQAYIRAEAQRRLEARKQALGVVTPSSTSAASPTLDTTIEDRLAQEKKEAEEKAREAERQAEEREKQRKEKLEAEKALKGGKTSSPTPTTTAPPPAPVPAPLLTPTVKTAPPPPKSRAPAPPPPRKGATLRTPAAPKPAQVPSPPAPRAPPEPTPVVRVPVPPAPVAAPSAPVEPSEDPEDAALRAREEALRKRREEREALFRKLEQEEEEARRAEAAYQERRNQFLASKSTPAVTVPSPSVPPPPSPPASVPPVSSSQDEPAEEAALPPLAPPPPPPPAPPASAPAPDKSSTNPFSRLMKEGGGAVPATPPTTTANGSSNPFFRAQTAPPAAPPPSKSPGIPPPVKTTYHTAPKDSDDDWDDVLEKEDDDSSDEELGTRDTRMGLAQQLFGNLLPSRPQSAGPGPSSGSPVSPPAPPPPPSAPPAPSAPSAPIAAPAPTGDRGALLSAIQVGARLRKTVTNDRSGAATSGRVVGDTAPPSHINAVARPPSPSTVPDPAGFTSSPSAEPAGAPLMGQSASFSHGKKESVDWYNALAADANKREVDRLPVTVEEGEEEQADASVLPSIQVSEHAPDNESELMADIDLSTELRVRSLYPYVGQRDEDLDFDTNSIIVAHPSKSGSDWWYGTIVKDGKAGFFPQTYVQTVEQVYATALYSYESTNADELSVDEGDMVIIVDRSETDWWKAEHDGLVFVVPAAYLEVIEDISLDTSGQARLGSERSHRLADTGSDGDHYERVSDVYSTPYTSPQDTRQPKLSELLGTPSVYGDEDEEDAYYSLDEGDSTSEFELVDVPEGERETVAREIERRQVLEAAGLVVSPPEAEGLCPRPYIPSSTIVEGRDPEHGDHGHRRVPSAPAPSLVTRAKSGSSLGSPGHLSESPGRKRRPAPAVPSRHGGLSHLSTKDLPPIPTLDLPTSDPSLDVLFCGSLGATEGGGEAMLEMGMGHFKARSDGCIVHPDDAFERYESFKRQASQSHGQGHGQLSTSTSRMSMSSFDTGSLAPTSPPKSPAISVTPSLREREREGGESRTSQFLSFLGRHARAGTPDIAERDRKLVISGPITLAPTPSPVSGPLPGGETGPPTRADSPVFGSSWASLVDRSALEEIPKQERKRQEAIFELISTEADYVRDVQLIVELFYSRLMQILDEKETEMIFSNIEDILLTNTTFLSTLEERQRDCRLYIDHISDLLERHMPNMAVYLSYCVNQANAGKVLQQMREGSPALATQLQNLREDPSARNLDLSSYLLVPMQRLTRYPLLIRQVLHYTEDAAERETIFAALQTAEKILEEVNETIRDQEGRERLGEISRSLWIGQGRLDLTAPTRHLGPRKLIKEGVLSKAKSGRKLRVLLCNDILVLVDEAEKGLYRVPISVNEIQIKPSRSGREDPLIRLHLAYPRGGDAIVLRAANVREAKAWQDGILDAGSRARQGIRNVVWEPGKT